MSHNLSRRQLEVLRTLQRLSGEQGYMPSVRELGGALGLSPATTQQHLAALVRKGFLASDGSAHGLRILVDPEGSRGGGVRESAELADPPELEIEPTVPVPLVGSIAAGRPIEAIEAHEQTIPVAAAMAREGDYLLHVRGDSMIEDGILDGDLVLIRPQPSVHNGQIAVGLLEDGTATLKRVYREGGRIRLQPANRTMEPLYVDRLRIQGRVVGLIRMY